MQRFPKQLVPTTQLTASAATIYTVPERTRTEISGATATNVTGTNRTVTVYCVPSGGSAATTNIVVRTRTVPANQSVQLWELIGALNGMPEGAFLQALADAASAVNLSIGGNEVSL